MNDLRKTIVLMSVASCNALIWNRVQQQELAGAVEMLWDKRRQSAKCLVRLFLWAEREAEDVLNDPNFSLKIRSCTADLILNFGIAIEELSPAVPSEDALLN